MNIERLYKLLNLRRPHGSEDFVASWLFDGYKPTVYKDKDEEPMAWVITTDDKSNTLFSCHLDTVHSSFGHREVVTSDTNLISSGENTPLGADDGAGVWLLLEMIDAGVPGTYIFHSGEEKGGIGSKWMSDHATDLLSTFKRAIAFDRKGTFDVITHQFVGRCCSDAFAEALASELNANLPDGFDFMSPCDGGVYTDTAEYTGLIPECTNVSCGYKNEHTANETLDLGFLIMLRDAAIKAKWEDLPVVRNVTDVDDDFDFGPYRGFGNYSRSNYSGVGQYQHSASDDAKFTKFTLLGADDFYHMRRSEMRRYIEQVDGDTLIDAIDEMAIEIMDLRSQIEEMEYQNLRNEGTRRSKGGN